MDQNDRDRAFERALAQRLRSHESPKSAAEADRMRIPETVACPDTEILAAFHERALPAAEIEAVQAHVSACGRCQETLDLLRATDSVALGANSEKTPAEITDISRAHRPKKLSKWVAPAGAIAAGLLIWIVARDNPRRIYSTRSAEIAQQQRLDDRQDASSRARESDISPDAAPPAPPQKTQSEKSLRTDADAARVTPREKQDSSRQAGGAAGALSAQDDSANSEKLARSLRQPESKKPAESGSDVLGSSADLAGKKLQDKKTEDFPAAARNEIAVAPKSQPILSANQLPQPERDAPAKQKSEPGVVASAPAAAASVQPDVAKDAPKAKFDETGTKPSSNNAPAMLDQKIEAVGNLQSSPSTLLNKPQLKIVPLVVIAPGGATQWRLRAGAIIEHSSDGGKTWSRQNSGITAELLVGSAPSEAACWLAGRGGTILRTTDSGAHWSRVVAPFPGDISRISATDALHATIVISDPPVQFTTSDGGVLWVPVKETR